MLQLSSLFLSLWFVGRAVSVTWLCWSSPSYMVHVTIVITVWLGGGHQKAHWALMWVYHTVIPDLFFWVNKIIVWTALKYRKLYFLEDIWCTFSPTGWCSTSLSEWVMERWWGYQISIDIWEGLSLSRQAMNERDDLNLVISIASGNNHSYINKV